MKAYLLIKVRHVGIPRDESTVIRNDYKLWDVLLVVVFDVCEEISENA